MAQVRSEEHGLTSDRSWQVGDRDVVGDTTELALRLVSVDIAFGFLAYLDLEDEIASIRIYAIRLPDLGSLHALRRHRL